MNDASDLDLPKVDGPLANLGAYGVSILGLAALLPASGRLLTIATDWTSRRD